MLETEEDRAARYKKWLRQMYAEQRAKRGLHITEIAK